MHFIEKSFWFIRKTRVGEYEVTQIRPARWIGPDKVIVSYGPWLLYY